MASKYAGNTDHAFLKLNDTVLGTYNLWDCHYGAALVGPLQKQVDRCGNRRYYDEVVGPLQEAVANMACRGIPIDRGVRNALRQRARRELSATDLLVLAADVSHDLAKPTGKSPNGLGSPKRLGNFLFNQLGLKPLKQTDKGFPSTDQEALDRLLRGLRKKDAHARPILEALFHRSRWKTIGQRYLTFDVGPDGKSYPTVKMCGTKTWRFAYENPPKQQEPPEVRGMTRASPGNVLIEVDYSQLEARLLAHQSGDQRSIQAFEDQVDIHVQNAVDMMGWKMETWPELDEETQTGVRSRAKNFLYGLSYGGQAETMKVKLFCPCSECRANVPFELQMNRNELRTAEDRWFAMHPQVKKYQEDTAEFVRRNHYFQSPLFEARRHIATPWGRDLEREVKNIPQQFGGAILMNHSQVLLDRERAPIIFQNHDAFILDSPEREVDYWIEVCREIMRRKIPELGDVRFPVDVEVGENWGNMEKM